MPHPTLRLITAVDAAAYKAFKVEISRETDFLATTGNEVATKDREYFTKLILREDRTPWHFWLIAEEGGKIVGDIQVMSSDLNRCAHSAKVYIALCKSYWGTGLAKRLMLEGQKWAAKNGVTQLTLSVMATNARAIAFYEKQGFKACGSIPGRFKVNGQAVDEVMMVKAL